MSDLITGLQDEIKRVKELKELYDSLPNNAGAFASGMMTFHITEAEKKIAIGDTVGMLQAFKALQEFTN